MSGDGQQLVSSISRLEADTIAPALRAVLDRAYVELRPSSKSVSSSSANKKRSSLSEKKNLSSGLLALLQHAGKLAEGDGSAAVKAEVGAVLTTGLRSQPWLWDFFVKHHLQELLTTHYHAAALLLEALGEIGDAEIGKALTLLTPHLRLSSSFQPSHSSLAVCEKVALAQVQRSVKLFAMAIPANSKESDIHPSEVHLTLRPSLPSALQFLGVFRTSIPYVRALSLQLSNPDAIALTTDLFPSTDAKDPLCADDDKTLEKLNTLQSLITVVIEGMLSFEYGEKLSRTVAALIAVHWELSQFLAAAAASNGRPHAPGHHRKRGPLTWSVDTCNRFCRILMDSGIGGGPYGGTASLLYPPSLVAHGMSIVKEALHGNSINAELLQTVLGIQEACYVGLLHPYAAPSLDGNACNASLALGISRRLHALVTGGFRGIKSSNIFPVDRIAEAANGSKDKKETLDSTLAGFQGKKRKNQSDAAEKQKQKAVEDLMKLFSSASEEPNDGGGEGLESENQGGDVEEKVELKKVRKGIGPTTMRRIVPTPIVASIHSEQTTSQQPTICSPQAPQPSSPQRGSADRVVMRPLLGMDQAEREAMWQAYIRDKDRLVEMLGDSSYREWYDESNHPVHVIKRKSSTKGRSDKMEAAFDAVFGRTAVSASQGEDTHSPSLLYLSTILPWQAALASSVSVLCSIEAEQPQNLASYLTTAEQRKFAVTTALKILEPVHSRNAWAAASKLAEQFAVGGAALHFAVQLITLCNRTGRHTAAPTLEAYTSLLYAICRCKEALEEQNNRAQNSLSAREAPYFPYALVARLVRTVLRFPPLLSSSITPCCAATLPLLTTMSLPSDGAIQYLAALLWLASRSAQSPGSRMVNAAVPDWVSQHVVTTSIHPLAVGQPSLKRAAVVEAVGIVLERCQREFDALDMDVLFPLAQASVSLARALALASPTPSPAADQLSVEALVSFLARHMESMAAELACILEKSTEATPSNGEEGQKYSLETRGRLLGLGLEFFEELMPHTRHSTGVLVSCLKVLESGYSSHMRCVEALRGADQASATFRAVAEGVDEAPLLLATLDDEEDIEEEDIEEEDIEEEDIEEEDIEEEDIEEENAMRSVAGARKKRVKDIRNPYLRAIMAEGRRGDGVTDADLSDLEDFIVANPSRDYEEFITNHFPMPESDEEESEESEG